MDVHVKGNSFVVCAAMLVSISMLMFTPNTAYSNYYRGYYGGDHIYHNGNAGYRHGVYLPGGYFHGYYRSGWNGYPGGFYTVGRCGWIPGHYNRWGNWVTPHRSC